MVYDGRKVSVVIPAYNEEMAIGKTVKDFSKIYVDEIIVVDNNSTDKTGIIAKKFGAKVVNEKKQGYGHAIIRGLKETNGDIIILTEGDATFIGNDMKKLLVYIDDVDMVLGTRLTKELMEKGAKMNWFLYWGNYFLAKLIQLRYWGKTRLTDVGCTFRAIKRESLKKIINKFKVGGSEFSPEMIIVALKNTIRTVEIPVHYKTRIGESKITSSFWKSLKVGLRMLKLILTR
jgi:glycosyltransferase involved in cell wall biosynthesis